MSECANCKRLGEALETLIYEAAEKVLGDVYPMPDEVPND